MDRDTFVVRMNTLIACAKQARIVAEAFGSPLDCEGFIGDLINECGRLILTQIANTTDEDTISDKVWEEFWGLINNESDVEALINFYETAL